VTDNLTEQLQEIDDRLEKLCRAVFECRPPTNAMNPRRFMSSMGTPPRCLLASTGSASTSPVRALYCTRSAYSSAPGKSLGQTPPGDWLLRNPSSGRAHFSLLVDS
jgi:hypothetical protein